MNYLERISYIGGSFNAVDSEKFQLAIKLLRESLGHFNETLFCADNLITWNRNLSFLRDPFYARIVNDKNLTSVEQSIVWRTYILLHFAELSEQADGDFLELGCHTGYTASQVVKKVDFSRLKKEYYLYDLFEWKLGDEHNLLEGHKNPQMFEDVVSKFSGLSFVHVIKGSVPDSFSQGFPEKIAFAHIDMNHPDPEAGALVQILPRLSRGGAVVFDDYGWWVHSAQKIVIDPIVATHNLKILELPTGQGLLLKP